MPTPARLRHGLQARVRTAGAEHGLRGLQHALAIAHRIGAGLSNGLWSAIGHLITIVRLNRIMLIRCLRMSFENGGPSDIFAAGP